MSPPALVELSKVWQGLILRILGRCVFFLVRQHNHQLFTLWYCQPSELSVKMSTKDMATTANSTEPTLPEAPAATEATHIVPVLPVTDTANDLDAPLSTKAELAAPAVSFKAPERQDIATHASAPESEQTVVPAEPELVQPVPSEPELGTAPAVLELEEIAAPAVAAPDAERTATPEPNQSTATPPELQEVMHVAPQSEEAESPAVSKPGHSITPEPEPIVPPIAKDIEQITPAGLEPEKVDPPVDATPETSAHTPVSFSKTESSKGLANGNCAPVLPAPSASEPAVPTLAVDITETPVGPSHTTKPVAAPSKSDDKAQTNGNSLSTKDKHVFPSSEKSEGDGTSSKTGSLPARKKRQSIFGKVKKFFEHKN